MLKMSFLEGNLDQEKLIDFIKKTDKIIKYGFSKTLSKEQAIRLILAEPYLEVREYENFLILDLLDEDDILMEK